MSSYNLNELSLVFGNVFTNNPQELLTVEQMTNYLIKVDNFNFHWFTNNTNIEQRFPGLNIEKIRESRIIRSIIE